MYKRILSIILTISINANVNAAPFNQIRGFKDMIDPKCSEFSMMP
jgi:hypothetical protein